MFADTEVAPPGGGGPGGMGGNFIKYLVAGSSMWKNWAQSDLRYYENEGSKRF